jgi:hypothetical protein
MEHTSSISFCEASLFRQPTYNLSTTTIISKYEEGKKKSENEQVNNKKIFVDLLEKRKGYSF